MEEILISACLQPFIDEQFKCITDQYDLRIVVLTGVTIQIHKGNWTNLKKVVFTCIHDLYNYISGYLVEQSWFITFDAKLSSFAECITNIQGYLTSIIPDVTLYTQITTIAPVSIKHYRDYQFKKNHLIYSFLSDHDVTSMQKKLFWTSNSAFCWNAFNLF